MANNVIKTETTAEQYMVEVMGPKIEAIEESLDSLKEDQATVLNAVRNDNEALKAKFEEMRAAKAQGRQFVFCDKEDVDASLKGSIGKLLNDNLIQRTIRVDTSVAVYVVTRKCTRMDFKSVPLETHSKVTKVSDFTADYL